MPASVERFLENASIQDLGREISFFRQGHVPRKKKGWRGYRGEWDYFEPEMRVISINILCWEGSDRLGKGVCCPGSGNRRNVTCNTTTHRAAGLCQPDS